MPALTEDLRDLCNDQITNELYASHLYLSMAAYFDDRDLPGCAAWMRAQSDEERDHAMRFYDHLVEREGRIELEGLDAPETSWESPQAVFEEALAHEERVTGQIYEIYAAAEKNGDYALKVFLDWFVEEQVEEERTAKQILHLFRAMGDDPGAVYEIDRRLAERGSEV